MVDAYFPGSSALLKRNVPGVGTDRVQSITDAQSQNLLVVARIAWVEICSAVARRQREASISSIQANQILAAFRAHWNTQYSSVEIDNTVIDLAEQLVNQHLSEPTMQSNLLLPSAFRGNWQHPMLHP